jgi:DNA mismatch repair protein MLH3
MVDSSKLSYPNPIHGGRGTFLASLSSLALLSITSHHHLHHSHNTISFHKSEVVARQTPAPAQQYLQYSDHGTRVTVRDLFGSMPVRVKQRAITAEKQRGNSKDWEELRRSLVALLLSWHSSVAVTVREAGTLQKMAVRPQLDSRSESSVGVDVSKACTILSQAGFITPADRPSWVHVTASTNTLTVNGTISLDPSATKHVQFLSLGIQPLVSLDGQSILHDEINRLFLNSAFGNEEEAEDLAEAERVRRANDARYKSDGYTNKELKGGKKGVDRWPMFYINIQHTLTSGAHKRLDVDDVLDDKGNSLSTIIELLRAMILEFLTRHHFQPKAGRGHQSRRNNQDENVQSQISIEELSKPGNTDALQIPRPTSAPNLSAGESLSGRKNLNSQPAFNSLGTNIRLPLFRRSSSQIDSPFDSWSKIKRGAAAPKLGTHSLDSQKLSPTPRPASASPTISRKSTRLSTRETPATPLISKSGKIIRRPFEDLVLETPNAVQHPVQPPPQTTQQNSEGDELVEWINPVTKVKSLVNKRTGLTVVATKACSSNGLGKHSVSQGPLQSREKLKRTPALSTDSPSPWITNILQGWENPVFNPAEPSIPQVAIEGVDTATQSILHGRHYHCSQIDIDRAFKDSSAGITGRISKDALRNAEVVSQVDKKFILVKLRTSDMKTPSRGLETAYSGMLVIVDQHAADERIRIEGLMEELCTLLPDGSSASPAESRVQTTYLEKPLAFDLSHKEIALLGTHKAHFADWGILYDLPSGNVEAGKATQRIQVRYLPPGIIERCKLDPRLLIELIRTEAWNCAEKGPRSQPIPSDNTTDPKHQWLHRIHNCPQGLIDMLNSRACRSAIMFNDELSLDQCKMLVRRLAGCMFPFQCAHGRPSLVPLVDLGRLRLSETVPSFHQEGSGQSFGSAFGAWSKSRASKSSS